MTEDRSANTGHEHHSNQNPHHAVYHNVYVLGTSVLVGIADFIFLWPESHLAAFLVLAAWLGLVAIYE